MVAICVVDCDSVDVVVAYRGIVVVVDYDIPCVCLCYCLVV